MKELEKFLDTAEESYREYLNDGDTDAFRAMEIHAGAVFEDWMHEGEKVEAWGYANDFNYTPLIYIKHSKDGHEKFHFWELELLPCSGIGEPLGHGEPMFKWKASKIYSPDWDSIIDGAIEDFIWARKPMTLM